MAYLCKMCRTRYVCVRCAWNCFKWSGSPYIFSSIFSRFSFYSETASEKRHQWEKFTRYVTYMGLCIATCLTFKSSTWIASIIGVAVALYISISEYWLNTHPKQAHGAQSLENFFQQQILSWIHFYFIVKFQRTSQNFIFLME